MKKYYFNKLVRDKIPEIIVARNGEFETKKLSVKESLFFLRKKLIEEAMEVDQANGQNIVDEMADVLQVMKSITELLKLNFADIEKRQKEKAKTNGEFKKRIFLLWTDKPKGFNNKNKK